VDLYDELMDLVVAYSNSKIKYLAKWIIDYKKSDDKKEMDFRLEKLLYLNRFSRMADSFAYSKSKDRNKDRSDLFEYYSAYIKPLIPNKFRYDIDELCYKGLWQDAVRSIAEIDGEMEADRYGNEYERLVTDTEYLIGQLLMVMKTEYAKRLENAKKAMNEYINPHRALLERLGKSLNEAGEELAKIGRSELPQEDKAEISNGLQEKIRKIEGIEKREIDNMRSISAFVDEIRKTYSIFNSVILSIERKKDLIEERKEYSGFIRKLEIETSELDELFRGLNGELDRNVEKARESMELLTSTFQDKIVDIISDQERVNRILEAEKAADEQADAEMTLNHEYYEDILKILKKMNN